MSGLRRSSLALALLGLMALSLAAPAEPPSEDIPKKNRPNGNDTDRPRFRPEDWKKFRSLSPEQKERLRKADRDFRSLDPKKQEHLRQVMDRYQAWLQHLPEADRKRIESAPNRE